MSTLSWIIAWSVYGSCCFVFGCFWASRKRDDDIDWEDAA